MMNCAAPRPRNVAAHRDQTVDLELEADHEHQHDDAELGNGEHLLGRAENAKPGRANRNAGDDISHDRREAELARDRDAEHRRSEKRQRRRKKDGPAMFNAHGLSPMRPACENALASVRPLL
jgi:hypothetical protein